MCVVLILCMIILIFSGEINYKDASNIYISVKHEHEQITNRENSFAAFLILKMKI